MLDIPTALIQAMESEYSQADNFSPADTFRNAAFGKVFANNWNTQNGLFLTICSVLAIQYKLLKQKSSSQLYVLAYERYL